MFEQLSAPNHVMALRFSGKLTGQDIKDYKPVLEDKLAKHEQLGVYIDFIGLSDINADALIEGTKADLEFFSHISQFSRCAFVSDKEWPQAMIGFMNPMLPTLEMKVFKPDQRDAAMQWVAERPKSHKADTSAMRLIPTSKDDVLGFEVNGVVSTDIFPGIIDEVNAFLDRHDKVRMLSRIKHLGGFDPAIYMQSGLFSMKFAAMQKVERYAIVGAPGWMEKAIKTFDLLFPGIDMRTFPADQEADAWVWLDAEPSA